jgi:hypothetical protein
MCGGRPTPIQPHIAKRGQSVRLFKQESVEMVEQIHQILCVIIHLYYTSDTDGLLPIALLYDIGKFTEYGNLNHNSFHNYIESMC